MARKLIDLSHTIEDGLITYKGLPAPIICDYWSREESAAQYSDGSSFHIGKMELVSNTGTYLDTPFHRFAAGEDTALVKLEQLAGLPAVKVSCNDKAISKSAFEGLPLKRKAVLIQTNWSRHWRTDHYFEDHPYLTEDAAHFLIKQQVVLVGIDGYNIDNTAKPTRPIHTALLRNGILIVEHLCNLDLLPVNDFTFTAAPPKIKGMGTFPVRAFAEFDI